MGVASVCPSTTTEGTVASPGGEVVIAMGGVFSAGSLEGTGHGVATSGEQEVASPWELEEALEVPMFGMVEAVSLERLGVTGLVG